MTLFTSPTDAIPGALARAAQLNNLDVAAAAAFTILSTNILPGYAQRSKFTYTGVAAISLHPAVYHHDGTLEQFAYWNNQFIFTVGSGGSNAASEDLGASEWHYLYIDDSTMTDAIVTAANLVNNTTAPTWSNSKRGWYNGSDRCIFAFYSSAASQIEEFFHSGEYVQYGNSQLTAMIATPSNAWADVTLDIPGFSVLAFCTFTLMYIDTDDTVYTIRTNGQVGATGLTIGRVHSTRDFYVNSESIIMTDASQVIEHKFSAVTANTATIRTVGWYFPQGM